MGCFYIMSQFNDLLGNNGFAQNLLVHGETVVIRPKTGGCSERTATVDRQPPAVWDAVGNAVAVSLMVHLHNDEDTGWAAEQINTGGDKIDVALRYGAALTTHVVFQLVTSDGGITTIAVR